MWSVSRLHVAGTVAGCCPLVSALLSDSLRAAAGSRSAPPGVSTGTNPLRHPRVCDPWRHYVPPVGQAVKLSRKCPPSSSSYAFTPRSLREDLSAIFCTTRAIRVHLRTGAAARLQHGFFRHRWPRRAGKRTEATQRSSDSGLICWFVPVLACWERVRFINTEERVCLQAPGCFLKVLFPYFSEEK